MSEAIFVFLFCPVGAQSWAEEKIRAKQHAPTRRPPVGLLLLLLDEPVGDTFAPSPLLHVLDVSSESQFHLLRSLDIASDEENEDENTAVT